MFKVNISAMLCLNLPTNDKVMVRISIIRTDRSTHIRMHIHCGDYVELIASGLYQKPTYLKLKLTDITH